MRSYIALIHKDAKSDFGVSFPDFPGCITAGKTLDEARTMAAEALALHVEGLIEDGAPLPEPSSLTTVMADAANRDAVAILVDVPAEFGRAVRVNVTLPDHLLATIDKVAEESSQSRSAFLAAAARIAIQSLATGAKPELGKEIAGRVLSTKHKPKTSAAKRRVGTGL
jgi:predicted RNase H-like HicB family nuclease